MMNDEYYVRLRLCSQTHPPAQITEAVGLKPDKEWQIGDRRANTTIVERSHGWIVDSQCDRDASFSEHLSALMERILPFSSNIHSLRNECSIELSCVLYSHAANPGLWIDRQTMQSLAALGAELDVDIYFLGSPWASGGNEGTDEEADEGLGRQ